MTRIPSHNQWLEDTKLNLFRRRDPALRAVDEAILRYESSHTNGNLWRLYYALEDWKRSEGPSWQVSAPNRKQAVALLEREIARVADAWTQRYLLSPAEADDHPVAAGKDDRPGEFLLWRLESGTVRNSGRADTRPAGELRGRHRAARRRTA